MSAFHWDCERQGCFNKVHRPRFEMLNDVLPGKIGFTDIDAIVEINGRGLMIEWKGIGVLIPKGQEIMFRRLTSRGALTVFVVEGHAYNMTVESLQAIDDGEIKPKVPATLDTLRDWIIYWVEWARGPQWN